MRIARALALAGIDSRRKCEAYILRGEVAVNGEVARDLGRQVDPERDAIAFRGKPLRPETQVYFILNKLAGYTTTVADPHAQKTVFQLLPPELVKQHRVFPVGRLDRESTGLLLFTNDGELANRLTHPRYEVGKWYEVRLDHPLDSKARSLLLKGIRLEDGIARAEQVQPVSPETVRLLLREGKKREIRCLFERLGYQVISLCRTAFGPLRLGSLRPGQGRFLPQEEIRCLKTESGQKDFHVNPRSL